MSNNAKRKFSQLMPLENDFTMPRIRKKYLQISMIKTSSQGKYMILHSY
jgi:hypothetical protein